MSNKENFGTLISRFLKGDKNASEVFFEHISIIMDQWSRKNKFELCWNAGQSRTIPVKVLCRKVYDAVFLSVKNQPEAYTEFRTYKNAIIETAERIMAEGFKEFNHLLIDGDNSSWKLVDEKLKRFSAKWFYERKSLLKGNEKDVYNASVAILYEKISSTQKYFNNSYGLKSYFFCILENKALENNRKKPEFIQQDQDMPEIIQEWHPPEEPEERIIKIRNNISRLSEIEQYIIVHHFWNEKKLNEIAEELQISFENCRVIKHRAIKKIAGYLDKNK